MLTRPEAYDEFHILQDYDQIDPFEIGVGERYGIDENTVAELQTDFTNSNGELILIVLMTLCGETRVVSVSDDATMALIMNSVGHEFTLTANGDGTSYLEFHH